VGTGAGVGVGVAVGVGGIGVGLGVGIGVGEGVGGRVAEGTGVGVGVGFGGVGVGSGPGVGVGATPATEVGVGLEPGRLADGLGWLSFGSRKAMGPEETAGERGVALAAGSPLGAVVARGGKSQTVTAMSPMANRASERSTPYSSLP
jgi:hypothetical protein